MKFAELDLDTQLINAINELGYTDCTPIQAAVIPHVLQGKDVAGLAQTGTGKTAAYLIPIIDRIIKGRNRELPEEQQVRALKDWQLNNFILILVPTRELAEQVQANVQSFAKDMSISSVAIYGGTSYDKQKEALKNHVDIIAATPGRLIDLYKEHLLDLKQVRAIIFDEADRMFDMGFRDDMKYVLSRVPRERQFLVFSATLNFEVLNTAYQFGAEPIEIDVSRDQARAENVKDEIFHVGGGEKPQYLLSILQKQKPKQTIIFTNFKNNVDRIAKFLTDNNIPAMGISSLLNQNQRNRVLSLFKAENDQNVLVATDVAARGLDIQGVDLVINYELPGDVESYVHRIGRTGRAGNQGQAASLVSDQDVDSLSRIESYLKNKLAVGWMEDTDIVKDFKHLRHHDDGGFKKPFASRPDRPPRNDRGGDRPQRPFNKQGGGRPPRGPRPAPGGQPPVNSAAPAAGAHAHAKPRAPHANGAAGPSNHQARPPRAKHPNAAASGNQAPHAHAKPNGAHKTHHKPAAGSSKRLNAHKPAPPTVVGKIGKFFSKLFK